MVILLDEAVLMIRNRLFWWMNEPGHQGQCGGGSPALANVMGTILWNQCILSHLKASEPFVAFQSHEVPLFAERLALNSQVGHEHGHTHTRVYTCVCTGWRRNDEPLAATEGLKSRHTCTQTHVYSAKLMVDDLIVFLEVHVFIMTTCLLAVPGCLLARYS